MSSNVNIYYPVFSFLAMKIVGLVYLCNPAIAMLEKKCQTCLTPSTPVLGHNTPEAYPDAGKLIKLYGKAVDDELQCTNMAQPLLSHDFVCEDDKLEFSEIKYHGIEEDLDLTHKCTLGGGIQVHAIEFYWLLHVQIV